MTKKRKAVKQGKALKRAGVKHVDAMRAGKMDGVEAAGLPGSTSFPTERLPRR
jgi:hypothetical protein